MARYRGPVGKVSRRLGFGITEKGERILQKKNYAPGMHGPNARQKKQSDYAVRMAEKQKAKYIYGLLEKQFRRTFETAKREQGETGTNLFVLLERRLDNVVYRLNFGKSRAHARQLVCHGHFTVNGRKTDIPSYTVKPGDKISVRLESRKVPFFKTLVESGDLTRRGPAWLQFDSTDMSAVVVSHPRREDGEQNIQDQLIVEYYSR